MEQTIYCETHCTRHGHYSYPRYLLLIGAILDFPMIHLGAETIAGGTPRSTWHSNILQIIMLGCGGHIDFFVYANETKMKRMV